MIRLAHRFGPGLAMLCWSGVFLGLSADGRSAQLLHPLFRPLALGAGVAMFVMACVMLAGRVPLADEAAASAGMPARGGGGRSLGLILAPLAAVALLSPHGFSAGTMQNRGVIDQVADLGSAKGQPQASPAANDQPAIPRVEVIDLLYATADPSLRSQLEGHEVELIAQMMPATNAPPARFRAVRMFMVCCAADARPVATYVEGALPPDVSEMSWIRVLGVPTFPMEGGKPVAVLKASKISASAPPEETMLY